MSRKERNAIRKEKNIIRQARQNAYMRELMDDLEGRPEEVSSMLLLRVIGYRLFSLWVWCLCGLLSHYRLEKLLDQKAES